MVTKPGALGTSQYGLLEMSELRRVLSFLDFSFSPLAAGVAVKGGSMENLTFSYGVSSGTRKGPIYKYQ